MVNLLISVPVGQFLFTGTVPVGQFLFTGTVPVRQFLFTGTVPVRQFLFTGTVPVRQFLFTGTVPVNRHFHLLKWQSLTLKTKSCMHFPLLFFHLCTFIFFASTFFTSTLCPIALTLLAPHSAFAAYPDPRFDRVKQKSQSRLSYLQSVVRYLSNCKIVNDCKILKAV